MANGKRNGGIFGTWTKLIFLGGAALAGYLVLKNYGTAKSAPIDPMMGMSKVPMMTDDGTSWIYQNYANDDLALPYTPHDMMKDYNHNAIIIEQGRQNAMKNFVGPSIMNSYYASRSRRRY